MAQIKMQHIVSGLIVLTAASLFVVPVTLDHLERAHSSTINRSAVESSVEASGARTTLASRYPLRQRTKSFYDRSKASNARR